MDCHWNESVITLTFPSGNLFVVAATGKCPRRDAVIRLLNAMIAPLSFETLFNYAPWWRAAGRDKSHDEQ